MPKQVINFNNTVIYKIVCNDILITDLYVGSTTHFINRKNTHKSSCNNENSKGYNLLIYKTIRNNGGWNNWAMIEIEKYPCNDRNEQHARERYWYEELQAKLNKNNPHITQTSESALKWRSNNTEQYKEYQKIYHKTHKKKYQKEYFKNHYLYIKELKIFLNILL